MKLTVFPTWRNAPMSTASSPKPDARHAAFDQVLRVMEKVMWPGAKAGAMSENPAPARQLRTPAERYDHAPAFDARCCARDRSVDHASEPRGCASARSVRIDVESHARDTEPALPDHDGAHAEHVTRSPITVASSSFSASGSTVHDALSREQAVPYRAARITSSAAPIASRAANTESGASAGSAPAPYRLTVMTGEAGVSIALRINHAITNADEPDARAQRALDELRRAVPRAVRVVVNGVEHISTTSQGIAHGH
ncbi:hypothetical protein [Paraburkholderia sp. UCT2]|uniref:hypothetical protein n=1 Tax=Paraburkholderia sp. UCT2 TaxID=2615208 RepID=UPI001655CA05|nr:hypothetical protein [Paraburkholderia sp. UCT2]MBC8731557.1 hypothetical protein [Paraburkholderia sp. UCT2]